MILADLAESVAALGDARAVGADVAAIAWTARVGLVAVAEPVATRGVARRATTGADVATIVGAARVVLARIAHAVAARALTVEVVMLRRGTCRVVETGDDEDGAEGTQKTARSHGGVPFDRDIRERLPGRAPARSLVNCRVPPTAWA